MVRAVLVLIVAAVATAAPVPPPSEKERIAALWGKTEGDGEFELKGKQLTLRTIREGATSLRVARTVRGDFTAEVLVVEAACPDLAKNDSTEPTSRAGLSVVGGPYRLQLHLLQVYNRGDDGRFYTTPQRSVWVDRWHPNGGSGTNLKDAADNQPVHLRITRTGKDVAVSHSFDGKGWAEPVAVENKLDFPDEVTVEVFLTHTTRQALHATFDKFTLEKPAEKK